MPILFFVSSDVSYKKQLLFWNSHLRSIVDSPVSDVRGLFTMFVLGIMAAGVGNGGSMRILLLILLLLAILFLLAGAIIAVVALRNQRKDASGGTNLERFDTGSD